MVLLFVQVLAQAVYGTFPVVQALPARAAYMILPTVRKMAFLFSTIATIFSFSASVPESIQAVLMLSKLLLLPVQVLAQVVCMALALLLFAPMVYRASALPSFVPAVYRASALLPFAQVVYTASALLPFSQAVYKASAVVLLVADTPPQALDNSAVLYD